MLKISGKDSVATKAIFSGADNKAKEQAFESSFSLEM